MSQNPQPPDSFNPPEQDRINNYTAPTSVQFPPPSQSYYLHPPPMTSALHQVPVSLSAHNAPAAPPPQPGQRPQFVFDAIGAPQTQTNDLYNPSSDPPPQTLVPQPHPPPQAIPPSSHPLPMNNPADLYPYQAQSKAQYQHQIWQPDPSRHQTNTAALPAQLAPPHREQTLAPPQPQSIGYSSAYAGGVTRKRERPVDTVYSQQVQPESVMTVPSASLSDEGPSIDTRKGKERVQRPCTNCGEMNHIRKNKCWKCDKPKEPAKKRTKRVRRKKKLQLPMQALHPIPGAPSAVHRGLIQPEMNNITVERAESLVRVPFPGQEEVPSMFDSRNFGVIPGPQQQTIPPPGLHQPHGAIPTQRGIREFAEGTTFDETQGPIPQNHQAEREYR